MQSTPFLYTALKDRPKIFQIITISLFSFFVTIIVVWGIAATQNYKSYKSKSPEVYAGIKNAVYTKR